jgi:hypothetical protein
MTKKLLPLFIVIVVLIGIGSFYGGMKYGQAQGSGNRRLAGNFQNLTPEQQQQMVQRLGANGGSGMGQRDGNGSGLANGEIISKDNQSITVKLSNGGSKIIFYSETTEVGKFVTGVATDLEIGKNVVISGTVNQDGSITAKSIQIRPDNQVVPVIPNQPVTQ